MKHAILITLALQSTAFIGFAHAAAPTGGDISPPGITAQDNIKSTTTRAEVKADVKKAQANGSLQGSDSVPAGTAKITSTSAGTATRAEVKAETKEAAASGNLRKDDDGMSDTKKPMKKMMRKHKMKKHADAMAMPMADAPAK